jgi:cyclopropane fatty-acyl-phospholipid synthase-like methyltransferase
MLRILFDRLYYGTFQKKYNLQLRNDIVRKVIVKYGVQDWFIMAHKKIAWRCIQPLLWIEKNIDKNASILDTGTGIGLNMIWLAERGFTDLHGFDIDPKAMEAGREIAVEYANHIHYFVDNGLSPQYVKNIKPVDLIIAINWTYFLNEFCLNVFFQIYRQMLRNKGKIVLECIDSEARRFTHDLLFRLIFFREKLTIQDVYKQWFSEQEVIEAAQQSQFKVITIFDLTYKLVPRKVYIFEKID